MIVKDDMLKQLISPILAILFGAMSLYAGWVTTTLNKHADDITALKVTDAHFDGDLAVIDNKIQMLLDMNGLVYEGPKFHDHNQNKK